MHLIDSILTGGIAVFSLLAGLAWWRSATAKVPAPLDEDGKRASFRLSLSYDENYQLIADGVDVGKTLPLQSKWNTSAAAFACAAAVLQGVQTLLHFCLATWPPAT
jgi:hypothetical protein